MKGLMTCEILLRFQYVEISILELKHCIRVVSTFNNTVWTIYSNVIYIQSMLYFYILRHLGWRLDCIKYLLCISCLIL